jgi:hypothetical protein
MQRKSPSREKKVSAHTPRIDKPRGGRKHLNLSTTCIFSVACRSLVPRSRFLPFDSPKAPIVPPRIGFLIPRSMICPHLPETISRGVLRV